MTIPDWWTSNRYGLFVHASLASVPAWAPVGQYAEWYRSHLGEDVDDVIVHPSPMVEVLAHHRRNWPQIDSYSEFADLLDFARFDPELWADVAIRAGMSHTVMVAKHHDGLRWWDAPGDVASVVTRGPRRNVLGEWASAAQRAGLGFGTYYSLLDWADERYPTPQYVDEALHREVIDLVERYGSQVLWGDGNWGHPASLWRSDELLERARQIRPDLVANDRWSASQPDFRTFEFSVPDHVIDEPWELCRPIGSSFGYNRNELDEHHLDAAGIVALLTEVVAKGGNLALNIGPDAHGEIPPNQLEPLLEAGHWIRPHRHVLDSARPWRPDGAPVWGDASVRYLWTDADRDRPTDEATGDGGADDLQSVTVIDVGGSGRCEHLDADRYEIVGATTTDGVEVEIETTTAGLVIVPPADSRQQLASAYRVHYRLRRHEALELFSPDTTAATSAVPLTTLLGEARPGQVVNLADGDYLGPVEIPDGVTVRGLGPQRTRIVAPETSPDGDTAALVTLGVGSRLEHLTVGSPDRPHQRDVRLAGVGALILGVEVCGETAVAADRATVRGCALSVVRADQVDRVRVSRSLLRARRWETGVLIAGGRDHEVEGCEFIDHLCAIRLDGTGSATIRGNHIAARWWAIHLRDTSASHVVGNSITATMRAVDIDGGADVLIDANAVSGGDSGCIVERGATSVTVSGNHWSRCRIGLLAWDAGEVWHHSNITADLREPDLAVEIGPSERAIVAPDGVLVEPD